MRPEEPRNPRKNWQADYNKWWNQTNSKREKALPVPIGSEEEKQ